MSKKVLVLCQRKYGLDSLGVNVKDNVVPKIMDTATQILGDSDFSVEYMSDCRGFSDSDCDVDYKMTLGSQESEEFIGTNKGTYALIILNTCPFVQMNYGLIHELLEPGGKMLFSIFPRDSFEGSNPLIYWKTSSPEKIDPFNNLFEADSGHEQLYLKKILGGRKIGKRKSKSKRVKRLRRKRKTIKKH
jgi:hypothetical protein